MRVKNKHAVALARLQKGVANPHKARDSGKMRRAALRRWYTETRAPVKPGRWIAYRENDPAPFYVVVGDNRGCGDVEVDIDGAIADGRDLVFLKRKADQ